MQPGPGVRTWDEIKADKHRYTSQSEYEQVLKERADGSVGAAADAPDKPDKPEPAGGSAERAGELEERLERKDQRIEHLEDRNDRLRAENDRLRKELAEAREVSREPGKLAEGTEPASADMTARRSDTPESGQPEDRKRRIGLPGSEAVGFFGAVVGGAEAAGITTHMMSSTETGLVGAGATMLTAGYLWGKSKYDKHMEKKNDRPET